MKRTLLLLTLFLAMMYAYTQEAQPSTVNSAGGAATIGGNVYEWSFAEMMLVNTAISPNLIVTSGILQPTNVNVGINELASAELPMAVFPNPTSNFLNLATGFSEPGKLVYQLYDFSGKTLISESADITAGDNTTTLSLELFPSGKYILKVAFTSKNTPTCNGSFKIEKIR